MNSEVVEQRGQGRHCCEEGRVSTVLDPPRGENEAGGSTGRVRTPILRQFLECFLLFSYIIFRMNFIIILIISGISVSFIADEPTISEGEVTAFIDIHDQDSTHHAYIDLRDGENWCWKHNMWENVRIINPSRVRRKDD